EMPERLQTALRAISDCISGMQDLDKKRLVIAAAACEEGFVVASDGCVSIGAAHQGFAGDDATVRRARYEHRLMSVLAEMAELQERTVATVTERLGADEPGGPWSFVECAKAGVELSTFETGGAGLPPSPLRDMLDRLAADMARAKQRFGASAP
ncbi:hypothetical protein, partial [Mycobacterium simiae]